MAWKQKIVDPGIVMHKIKPGMRIFLGTGVSEPQTLTRHLMSSGLSNLADLELVQLFNLSGSISINTLNAQKYRLKTFYSGSRVDKAITGGHVDLIPCRFDDIHRLFDSGRIQVDAAFIQVSPPDESGKSSLGVSIDVARIVMAKAGLVAGEINPLIPRCLGNSFVNMSQFNYLVNTKYDPVYVEPWKAEPVFGRIAEKIARLIPDRSCLSFSIGPMFDALSGALSDKRHLGIHSPVFTDALMTLVESGAVSNLYKKIFPGQSVASYAFGSRDLMAWLDMNPRVQFHEVGIVFDPANIGKNPGTITVIPARKADLYGRIAFHKNRGTVVGGPVDLVDFFWGARLSPKGHTIIGLPARDRQGASNIRVTIERYHHQSGLEQAIDMVVTEHGVAMLDGLSVRERAQAMIDIAHPEDRKQLMEEAKEKNLLYKDQIFIKASHVLYPDDIFEQHVFTNGTSLRFRPIRPSDEDQMRRLFYRFSDEAIYYRYFHKLTTMPHSQMQKYVNVNWNDTFSIVGLVGDPGQGRIVAETRYLIDWTGQSAEVAFVVDEAFNNIGIATYLLTLLRKIGRERGVTAFTAEVLPSNVGMMKVFRKVSPEITSILSEGVYHVTMSLSD